MTRASLPTRDLEPRCLALDGVNCYVGFRQGHVMAVEYHRSTPETDGLRPVWIKDLGLESLVDVSIFKGHLVACNRTHLAILSLSQWGRSTACIMRPRYRQSRHFWSMSLARVVRLNGKSLLLAVGTDKFHQLHVLGMEWQHAMRQKRSCQNRWQSLPMLLDPQKDTRWMDEHAWFIDGRFYMLDHVSRVLNISRDGVLVLCSLTGNWWLVDLVTWRIELCEDITSGQKRTLATNMNPAMSALTCDPDRQDRGEYIIVQFGRIQPRHQPRPKRHPAASGPRLPFMQSPIGRLPNELLLLINDEVRWTASKFEVLLY